LEDPDADVNLGYKIAICDYSLRFHHWWWRTY